MKILFFTSLLAYIAVCHGVFTLTVMTNCIGPVCPSRPILCSEECPVNTFFWNECLSDCIQIKTERNPAIGSCLTVGQIADLLDQENGGDECTDDNN